MYDRNGLTNKLESRIIRVQKESEMDAYYAYLRLSTFTESRRPLKYRACQSKPFKQSQEIEGLSGYQPMFARAFRS